MLPTALIICRPFRARPDLEPHISFFFTTEQDIAAFDVEMVGSNFRVIYIEQSLAAALGPLSRHAPELVVIPDFVATDSAPIRLLGIVSSDTNVRLLAPVLLAFHTLAVVPARHEKDEGAIAVLREFGIPYVELRRSEPLNAAVVAFDPTIALTVADWTSEFLHVQGQLKAMGVPTVALQEGPHDLQMSFQQEVNDVVFTKVSNQYRNADIFLAQGARHLAFMRTKYFAVTGNPKIDAYRPVVHGLAPKLFINLNFTYAQTKPPYESERDLWLGEVMAAVRETKIPYLISQHPRDKAPISDPNLLPSHAGIVQEHLRQSTISVSRLSSLIYEAARDGLRSIYFNPHYEPIGLFNLGADENLDVCGNRRSLIAVLQEHLQNPLARHGNPELFLRAQCGPQDGGSVQRITRMIHGIAANRPGALHLPENQSPAAIQTNYQPSKQSRLRVAVFGRFPSKGYSGGRIHGWTIAEAAAHAGHDVTVVTPCIPEFSENFAYLPRHQSIKIAMSPELKRWQPLGKFDVVFMVPGMDRDDTAYRAAIGFAHERGAALVLINFESPNWFNEYSPSPRDETLWDHWRLISRHARAVLSSAEEGTRYAREFYTDAAPGCRFENVPCAINTGMMDRVPAPAQREKRVLIFTRRGLAEHKGALELPALVLPAMRGYIFTVVSGNELEEERIAALEEATAAVGASLDLRTAISDAEKCELLKLSSLLLFPSMFEGLGLPPMEAAYTGLPCVAFDLPVLREICGDYLVYARHGDFEDFRAKIAEALLSPPDMTGSAAAIARVGHIDAMAAGLDRVMQAAVRQEPEVSAPGPLAQLFRKVARFPAVAEPHISSPYQALQDAAKLPAPVRAVAGRQRVALLTLVPPVPLDQGNRLVTHHLVSHLLQQGYDVDLLLQSECSAAMLAEIYGGRVRAITVPMPDWRNTPENQWRRELNEKLAATPLAAPHDGVRDAVDREANRYHPFYIMTPEWTEFTLRALRTENYQAIYCNYLHTLLPVALLREAGEPLPGPVVVIAHDAMSRLSRSVDGIPLDTSFRYCLPSLEAEVLNNADVVVAITATEASYFREIGVTQPVVVSHYSGAEDFAAHSTTPSAFYQKRIVYTASNNPLNRHGFDCFLRHCWPRILEYHPNVRLQLAGPLSTVIRNYPGIEKLGILSREGITELLSQATMVINPGRNGTGLKIKTAEAICANVPFVTFSDGIEGIEEFAQSGYIAEDWDDFTLGCLQMLEDYDFWLKCHNFAAAHADEAMSRSAVFDAVDAAVSQLMAARRPAQSQKRKQKSRNATIEAAETPAEADPAALDSARQALGMGRVAEARRYLEAGVAENPGHTPTYELAFTIAEELGDAEAMLRLAGRYTAFDLFGAQAHLDLIKALRAAGAEKPVIQRALSQALLACPDNIEIIAAYLDAMEPKELPKVSAIWHQHAGDSKLEQLLPPETLARLQEATQQGERPLTDTAPLPAHFETAFVAKNVSDANWRYGVWQKDGRSGFTISTTQAGVDFVPGQSLLFRGSGLRKIVKVDGKDPNRNVWLDEPIDADTDGFPHFIFLQPPQSWDLEASQDRQILRIGGQIDSELSSLALATPQGKQVLNFLTYWRRDIETKYGLEKNQARGLTIEIDLPENAEDWFGLMLGTVSADVKANPSLRRRVAQLSSAALCFEIGALPQHRSEHMQLSSVEFSANRLFLKCYQQEPLLPQLLQIVSQDAVLLELRTTVVEEASATSRLTYDISFTVDLDAWKRAARALHVVVPGRDMLHWHARSI